MIHPRWEVLRTWSPEEWPPVGKKMGVPVGPGVSASATVIKCVPGDKIVVDVDGRRLTGRPLVVRDREKNWLVGEVWMFEEES